MTENLRSTLAQGAEGGKENSFSIGTQLLNAIQKKTIQKTGSKLLTVEKLKVFLGSVSGKAFEAIDRWMKGDKQGAILAFGCGVVNFLLERGNPLYALGAAAISIVATTLLKKMKGNESVSLSQGGVQCNR